MGKYAVHLGMQITQTEMQDKIVLLLPIIYIPLFQCCFSSFFQCCNAVSHELYCSSYCKKIFILIRNEISSIMAMMMMILMKEHCKLIWIWIWNWKWCYSVMNHFTHLPIRRNLLTIILGYFHAFESYVQTINFLPAIVFGGFQY